MSLPVPGTASDQADAVESPDNGPARSVEAAHDGPAPAFNLADAAGGAAELADRDGQSATTATIDTPSPVAVTTAPATTAPATTAVAAAPVSDPTRNRRLELQLLASQILLACCAVLAGFVVFVLLLSGLPAARAQRALEQRFALPLQQGLAPIGGLVAGGTPIARLDIPAIGLREIVVEGTSADELRGGPGHLPTSPFPGQIGNVVVVAHRLAWGGPFGSIGSLPVGAKVTFLTGQGTSTYLVTGHYTTPATDVSPYQATLDNRLTLVTAANLTASRRLIVAAKLVGAPFAAPAGRPRVLSAQDSGLVGQQDVLPALAFCVEILLAVAVGSVLLYRRFPRPAWYLMSTPVLLAALWLLYENLARLLPAAL